MSHTIFSSGMSSALPTLETLHEDFLKALAKLSSVSDTEFIAAYEATVRKVEHVFSVEEQWMEMMNFPVLKSHREQHAKVLGGLHSVYSRVLDGDFLLGREVIEKLLPEWLVLHMSTMDRTLAHAMQTADV